MKRALLLFAAALALMVVPLGAAATAWDDPPGDSGTAPDITRVTVSNSVDDVITFHVQAKLAPSTSIRATIDAVKSGLPVNHPYWVGVAMESSGSLSTFAYVAQVRSPLDVQIEASTSADAVTFSFPAAAFGIEDGFTFRVLSWDTVRFAVDNVPDFAGALTYWMASPAPPTPPAKIAPIIGKPVGMAAPVAGKKFTVSFPITSSVDGQPLTTGTAECKTTVAGKTVPHTHTFKGGTVKAVVAVPKAAKGKQLKIAVKVTADTAATRVFTFRVR